MTPVEPLARQEHDRLVVFAESQPEYIPLPASVSPAGVVMTEWELSAEELAALLEGGRVRVWLHTFNRPLQPISVEVTKVQA